VGVRPALQLPMNLARVEHLVEHALFLGQLPSQLPRARGALVRPIREPVGRQRAENLAELRFLLLPTLHEKLADGHAWTVSGNARRSINRWNRTSSRSVAKRGLMRRNGKTLERSSHAFSSQAGASSRSPRAAWISAKSHA